MRFGSASMMFVLLATFSAMAAEVRLRSEAGCAGAVVRVADVAEVFADDARVARALAEITLCPAPSSGGERLISQHEIRQMLALSGVDRKMAVVTGSELVTVTAHGHSHSSTGAKRPMVATGVRQAMFETERETDRKPKARSAIMPQTLAPSESKEPAEKPVVEKGMVVTVSALAAGVKITTSGKALDDGATGESIGVELADSKQRILARVTGPQTVEVRE